MKTLPLLALALFAQSVPAFAEPAAPRSQAVRTADLDLSNKQDRIRLHHRIRVAVNAVCGEPFRFDLTGQNKVKRCREETRQSVRAEYETAIAAAQRGVAVASAH